MPYTLLHAFYSFGGFYVFVFSGINKIYIIISTFHIYTLGYLCSLLCTVSNSDCQGTDHKNLPRSFFMWKQLHWCMWLYLQLRLFFLCAFLGYYQCWISLAVFSSHLPTHVSFYCVEILHKKKKKFWIFYSNSILCKHLFHRCFYPSTCPWFAGFFCHVGWVFFVLLIYLFIYPSGIMVFLWLASSITTLQNILIKSCTMKYRA